MEQGLFESDLVSYEILAGVLFEIQLKKEKRQNLRNFGLDFKLNHSVRVSVLTCCFILYLPNIANASIARYIKPIKTDEKIAKENGIGRRTSTKNITSIVDQSDSFFIKS